MSGAHCVSEEMCFAELTALYSGALHKIGGDGYFTSRNEKETDQQKPDPQNILTDGITFMFAL